jgi:hypothetical protein
VKKRKGIEKKEKRKIGKGLKVKKRKGRIEGVGCV